MVVGFDPDNGRSCQRSFSVHGDAEYAQRQRRELVDLWGVTRVAITSEGARLTTADLLDWNCPASTDRLIMPLEFA